MKRNDFELRVVNVTGDEVVTLVCPTCERLVPLTARPVTIKAARKAAERHIEDRHRKK
jgi:hypothetical protein